MIPDDSLWKILRSFRWFFFIIVRDIAILKLLKAILTFHRIREPRILANVVQKILPNSIWIFVPKVGRLVYAESD